MRAFKRKAAPRDVVDQLRLIRTEGVGPITYRRLMERYGSAAGVLDALPGLTKVTIPEAGDAEREMALTAKLGGQLVFWGDAAYPPLLAMLDDAPPCLAVAGDIGLLSARAVAVVGGRNASANGQRMAESLAAALAPTLVVVSGLARGIDAAAHKGAMTAGKTVAAIAGGLDIVYPPGHEDLQRRIAEGGAVVTEAPPGTMPQARHFPRRNRIVAGLALGVVVVEASLKSGSLITAGIAQDAGREIFAVPGSPLDPRSRGANDLLRQGAVMTETADDVLANLPMQPRPSGQARLSFAPSARWDTAPRTPAPDAGSPSAALLALLGPAPTAVDDLLRRCQFSTSAVMAALLELELAGRVETLPGNRIALASHVES
ncbi:MAG: DNA-processing protein DprA [Rhodospirillales bacterium]